MDKLKKVFLRKTLVAMVLLILSSNSASQLLGGVDRISLTDPYCNTGGYVETVLGVDDSLCEQPPITAFSLTDNNNALPSNVSDWVLIELRAVPEGASVDEATVMTVISRKSALLLETGHVVDAEQYRGDDNCDTFSVTETDDCPLVEFSFDEAEEVRGMDLYVVVRHFNHLDIISAVRMTTATGVRYSYDFTTQSARGGPLASKEVETNDGKRNAMYLGDVNGDTNINAADYLEISGESSKAADEEQEQASDINFNGRVDASDIASSKLQENLGRASQIP